MKKLSSTFPIWVLHKSRGTATLITPLRPKRACHGSAAPRRVADYKGVCPPVHGPGLAPSTGVAHRGHPYPRETDGDGGITDHGAGARTVFQELSSGAQSGPVVRLGGQPSVVDPAGWRLRAARAGLDGTGRYH